MVTVAIDHGYFEDIQQCLVGVGEPGFIVLLRSAGKPDLVAACSIETFVGHKTAGFLHFGKIRHQGFCRGGRPG